LATAVGIVLVARGREPRRGFVGEEEAGASERRRDDPAPRSGPEQRQAEEAESGEEGHGRGPATPDDEPLGTPAPERSEGMTVVVRGAVRVVSPVLAVVGLTVVVAVPVAVAGMRWADSRPITAL
jgi:multicomponent Na+:H+ antiporter subunit B